MTSADLLIVGGGLVGLTLATAFGSAGLTVAVVDRERPAAAGADIFDGRASAIAWGSAQALAGISLWEHLEPDSAAVRGVRLSDRASRLVPPLRHRTAGIAACA